jgi:hypothetical protein
MNRCAPVVGAPRVLARTSGCNTLDVPPDTGAGATGEWFVLERTAGRLRIRTAANVKTRAHGPAALWPQPG